jgi:hypothetical protein
VVIPLLNRGGIVESVMDFLIALNKLRPDILVVKSKSALPSRARNEGVFNRYLDLRHPGDLLEHEVYIFLDGDVLPDLDCFVRAIDEANADTFSTGIYEARGGKALAMGDFLGSLCVSYKQSTVADREYAEWAGGGLLLVGRNILREIEFPYFHESVISWQDQSGIERATIVGEDVSFCMKARSHNFKLRILHELEAKHLTGDNPEEEEP